MMVTRYISGIAFAVVLLVAPDSSVAANTTAQCGTEAVRQMCPASCKPSCGEESFLLGNVEYCIKIGALGDGNVTVEDGAGCAAIFETSSPQPVVPALAGDSTAGSECSAIKSIIQRKKCELAEIAPACAPTVAKLESKAGLLVTTIQGELSKYGDLLQREWGDVANRDALCALTEEELDEGYRKATEDPANLLSSQRQAQSLQACMSEWEGFVRNSAGTASSDKLRDSLARSSEQRLIPLGEQIQELSKSIKKLESAAVKIEEIVGYYVNYCGS
jgi:hypothetical protein